jgi:hypothetical protein
MGKQLLAEIRPLGYTGSLAELASNSYVHGCCRFIPAAITQIEPDPHELRQSPFRVARQLSQHPGVEIVCRDCHGLYAEGARAGAPQARQVADRFHLVQNLRDRIEQHLSGQRQRPVSAIEVRQDGADRANLDRADRLEGLQRLFALVHELLRQGWTAVDIARHLDINRRRVDKCVRLEALPERFQCNPEPTSPRRFHAPLQELTRTTIANDWSSFL